MLLPQSYSWTRRQRWFIAGSVVAGLIGFSVLVYSYERYYRGPNDSFFVGTWRGEICGVSAGDPRTVYRFNPDHTYENLDPDVQATTGPLGTWYAGGDFIYLRSPKDAHEYPHGVHGETVYVEPWHIDSMTSAKLHIHYEGLHIALERSE